MLNFLMVSTVFSKKQFTILSLREKSELNTLKEYAKGRNHLIIYPLITKKNVKDVSDLINEKMQKSLINEIETDHPQTHDSQPLSVINWNGFKVKNVLSIEHFQDDLFRIRTEQGSFISNSFEFFI